MHSAWQPGSGMEPTWGRWIQPRIWIQSRIKPRVKPWFWIQPGIKSRIQWEFKPKLQPGFKPKPQPRVKWDEQQQWLPSFCLIQY